MSSNSKKEFLSISSQGKSIICPACGNPMSMREFASYQLVFTPKARYALNTMVEHYVNFLVFFDNALLIHDQYGLDSVSENVIPYELNAEIISKVGYYETYFSKGTKILCESQERLAVLKKIRQLPKTEEANKEKELKELLDHCYRLVYGQLAPYDYVASLFEIVNQQQNIEFAVSRRGKITDEDIQSFLNCSNQKVSGSTQLFTGRTVRSDLGNWSNLLKNLWLIAPGYARYIKYIIELWYKVRDEDKSTVTSTSDTSSSSIFSQQDQSTSSTENLPRESSDNKLTNIKFSDEVINNFLMETAHVLNIFMCGGYIDFDEVKVDGDLSEKSSDSSEDNVLGSERINFSSYRRPYKFGHNSILQDWRTLGKFIISFPAKKFFSLFWPSNFVKKLDSDSITNDDFKQAVDELINAPEPGSPPKAELNSKLLQEVGSEDFLAVISSVVDFACRGKAMTLPNYTVQTKVFGGTSRNLREMARNWITSAICGWCPGNRDAYSLVLLGGTGSGKSSIAQSGLVALSDSLSNFGYSLSYLGPVDQVIFDFYHYKHYKDKEMPDATEEGARYTLTLALQKINNPKSRVDLTFTDVAGEKIESALLGGAEDPVVLGALSSANTFVYLFDFMAWQSFAAALNSEKLEDNWKDFLAQKEKLTSKSRAVRDSFEMLKAVVDKIYEIRKQEGSPDPYKLARESDFILVIPKADFYWKSNRFLSKFSDALKDEDIFQKSMSSGEDIYVSRGSFPKSSDSPRNIFDVAKAISDFTKNNLLKHFKDTFFIPETDVSYIESSSLASVLEKGVIEFLEKRFNNVYFLPVSAQGSEPLPTETKGNNQDGNKGVQLTFPPAQALCEFVFLIAAESAMKTVEPFLE